MGKDKRKRKKRKKEITAESAISDLDTLEDEADNEERRKTRLTAVIALIASVWAMMKAVYKLMLATVNVWPIKGIFFQYLQVLLVLLVSIIAIIIDDIISFLYVDLQRYNNKDPNHKKYDERSDDKYDCMISDFRLYIWIFLAVYFLAIPLSALYNTGFQRYCIIFVSFVLLVMGIVYLVTRLWKRKKDIKEVIKKNGESIIIKTVKIIKGLIFGLILYIVALNHITNIEAIIKISYNIDGMVEIYNASVEGYNKLDIVILDDDNNLIYKKSVDEEEVLLVNEDKYISTEVNGTKIDEGILVSDERIYWKYLFDLNTVVHESGKYSVEIFVNKDGAENSLPNRFEMKDKEYIYTRDYIEEKY